MRIVARLKRGSLFRLLFYAGVRAAPHTHRARLFPRVPPRALRAASSAAYSPCARNVTSLTSQVLHAHSHRTPIRYLATVRWKSNSIWQRELAARVYGGGHPPSRPFLSLSPDLLKRRISCLNSTSRCAHSRSARVLIGNANCGVRA